MQEVIICYYLQVLDVLVSAQRSPDVCRSKPRAWTRSEGDQRRIPQSDPGCSSKMVTPSGLQVGSGG